MIRSLFGSAIACLVLSVGLFSAHAQDVQVPFDTEGTLYTIDADLRDRLDLFPEVEGFQQATLYRVDTNDYELVLLYRSEGNDRRERRSLTSAEVTALRERVARRLQATGVTPNLDQSGRNDLLVATTTLGITEGGLLAAVLADDDFGDDGSLAASLPLLGGATGFFVPLLSTRNSRVSESAAALAGYGGPQGYAHATQLVLLGIGDDGEIDGRAVAALLAIGGAVESRIGYVIGNRPSWTPGMGETVAYTGAFGNGVGLGVAGLLVGGDDGFDNTDAVRIFSGLSLAGSVAGMYVGHRLSRGGRYTEGDARIYGTAGLLGTQVAGSILVAGNVEGGRSIAGTLLTGAVGGLGAGHLLARSLDFSKHEANISFLGTYAGSLFGSALAEWSDTDFETGFLLSSLGSALGFGLSLAIFSDDAKRRARSSSDTMQLHIRPTLPRLTLPSPMLGQASGGHRFTPSSLRPGLNLRLTF